MAAWLALIALILPPGINFHIGGASFSPGRIFVILLLVPAIFKLRHCGRRALLSDFFVGATVAWMMAASVSTGGWGKLTSAPGGEGLEFIGAYLIARGFFFEPAAREMFIRVLKVLAIMSIIVAIGDIISGRWIVQDIFAAIFNTPLHGRLYRAGMLRATSTFDHPILFGTFCSIVAVIFLYLERNVQRRILLVGFCFVGCILSQSSAALMSFSIALAVYSYDRLMKGYAWRWRALLIVVTALVLALFLVANHPIGWVLSNLTLDAQSAYFRILIWDAALEIIQQFPFTGYGYESFGNVILDTTIDSVWLFSALRYGVPMVVFLILANLAALWPARQRFKKHATDSPPATKAFTLMLVLFMFFGLTVHFWDFMWMFWGLCIGVRASLREQSVLGNLRYTGQIVQARVK